MTPEDVVIPEFCPVFTDVRLEFGGSKNSDPQIDSPSLDRFDPSLGYTPDNCKIISAKANRLKNNATIEELLAVVKWMMVETPGRPS